MPFGQAAASCCGEIGAAVVDAGVEAEFVDDVAAFFGAAGNADDAAALELGDLADHRADRAGGSGDHDGFAGLRLANVEQAHVGGEAGHAEDAQRQRRFGHRLGRAWSGRCRRTTA